MVCIDERILSSSFFLGDWPLSSVFLKNESTIPWFILVPRRKNIQEMYQLNSDDGVLLMEEMNQLSLLVKNTFNPLKLNIGALGNVVPQLHIHVVGRYADDALWPEGIWQGTMKSKPYSPEQIEQTLGSLSKIVDSYNKNFLIFP